MFKSIFVYFISLLFIHSSYSQTQLFNQDWEFVKDIDTAINPTLFERNSKVVWQKISIPHTANIEPIEKVKQQWQGIAFYRKFFTVSATEKGKHLAFKFDGAMQEADVYLNGKKVLNHKGGYLPFYVNVTDGINYGSENVILVKLNNQDNPIIPPGKPIADLDFNYYSGIYRNVWFIKKNQLHISDAVAANRKAGGGLLVHYENVTSSSATLTLQTEVENGGDLERTASIRTKLFDPNGKLVASNNVPIAIDIRENDFELFTQVIEIQNPQLWSPNLPYLYTLKVEVLENGKVIDTEQIKTGIRSLKIEASALTLNGEKIVIRGTNRHQEYPYVGNALSDQAQYRDAYKIKQAGFNFVRSSHYPHANSFLDACDELGILVMDAIPGWQFVGKEAFTENSYQDTRDMIRRDRNHPSIIMWEASLNESGMSKAYMKKTHQIVHEELPFNDTYSAGWIDDAYDVFLPARQHGKYPVYWKNYQKNKPLLIAEYGDWEYYAGNAGFNQKEYQNLNKEEKSSRQLRAFGQKRLLQQALNYQESHNDNLNGKAIGDANWLIFDYKRGYADDIESSGIMDIVRLPKFAFYFYQSQLNPNLKGENEFNKPMLSIANYWSNIGDSTVKIYSNCEEVELFLNGKSLGKQKPDQDKNSNNLKHPPFTFSINEFTAGTLTALGFINNQEVIKQVVKTPEKPVKINLRVDFSGKNLKAGTNDVVFVYAEVLDANGTIIPAANHSIEFELQGDAENIAPKLVKAEAGIATILLKAGNKPGKIKVTAKSEGLNQAQLKIKSVKSN
ncbi:glycoside hydrolase family 2 protein [Pedobacter cryophilus]|uniref:Glycoside hydrolase family 2 protein n=1 Tax=Pedobacter cryophilus TaxID=2571271 RepID=A0A4U1BVJ9_9SPHI|nr:glycoside hydrolase family 2 TIM barrel-domain containing protein [Pedobacter cryophilus]TKB96227.1 glycoside hydrolase family 2 protein [Pedobacter cryophilus]